MSDKYFVDTNILLYAHDRSAGVKHERARKLIEHLWATGEGVVSTQVLQELCVNLRKKVSRPLPSEEIRRLVEDYLAWEVVTNDATSVVEALDIEKPGAALRFITGCKPIARLNGLLPNSTDISVILFRGAARTGDEDEKKSGFSRSPLCVLFPRIRPTWRTQ
jgi:predicted nucleic acid-binding protein